VDILLTTAELDRMSQANTADRTKLTDIQNVRIDPRLPAFSRMERFIGQVQNPYCFLCGGAVVKVRFEEGAADLKNKLKNYFESTKKA
jgi:hypothetical protein